METLKMETCITMDGINTKILKTMTCKFCSYDIVDDNGDVMQHQCVSMEFISSNGYIYVNDDGTIDSIESYDTTNWLYDIDRVDIEELDNYLSFYDFELADGGDVLDFGYWDKDGVYYPPSRQWREDTFHKIPISEEEKTFWTREEILKVIDKSFNWIKENRL